MVSPTQDTGRRRSSSNNEMIRRIEALERYSATHGESLTALTQATSQHSERIKYLEDLAQMRAVAEAREDERDKALYRRLDNIDADIEAFKRETRAEFKGIKGIGSKALWIFFSAIILAVWQFIQSGGLAQ